MEKRNIYLKQYLIHNEILAQKNNVKESGPWLIINQDSLSDTFHNWIQYEEDYYYLFFFTNVFRKFINPENTQEIIYSVNKESYNEDMSGQEWVQTHDNWVALNRWDTDEVNQKLVNKVYVELLPYHIGWEKKNYDEIIIRIFSSNGTQKYQTIDRNFSTIYKRVKDLDYVYTEDAWNRNFFILGSPVRGYKNISNNLNTTEKPHKLIIGYDPFLQSSEGLQFLFFYNTIHNALFLGQTNLNKENYAYIYFHDIWDCDFKKDQNNVACYTPFLYPGYVKNSEYFYESTLYSSEGVEYKQYKPMFTNIEEKDGIATKEHINTNLIFYKYIKYDETKINFHNNNQDRLDNFMIRIY